MHFPVRFAPTLAVLVLLAVPASAQEAVESWTVPNFHGYRVSAVQDYWQTEANGVVTTEVSEAGEPLHPPTRTQEGMFVQANATENPPGSSVEAGGTVGVILVPLETDEPLPWWVSLLVGAIAGALAVTLFRRSRSKGA